jgi:hypothetical protein
MMDELSSCRDVMYLCSYTVPGVVYSKQKKPSRTVRRGSARVTKPFLSPSICISMDHFIFNTKILLPQGKKVGAARCEYVFNVHTSKASKRLKVVLLHLWRINVKTTGGLTNIPVEDFHIVKTESFLVKGVFSLQ